MMPPRAAPSPTLPLRYLVAAPTAFVLAAVSVPWLAPELAGHYYQPRVVALAHTVTLGWITMTIIGASYQLIPIVLERPLWSPRLASWQFVLLAVGIIGMVGHFFIAEWPGLVWSAGLVGAAIAAHLLNTLMSVHGLSTWTITARLVAFGLGGLGMTAVFGIVLAVDRVVKFLPGPFFPTLHAHFHLALLGWVLPMVIGVAARVVPMFLLAPEPSGWPARVQLWGLALGLPAVVSGLLVVPTLLAPGALAVAAGVAGHLAWVLAMVRSRRRPRLDWALRFVLTGAAFSVPAMALGVGFALGLLEGPRLGLAYAVLALGGWASLTIVGMMLKIVPFLVWYRVYAPRAGHAPVPTLAQLSSPVTEGVAYALLTAGMIGLAAAAATGDAAWIRAAGLVLAAGALAFAATLAQILGHVILRPARGAASSLGQAAT